MKSYQMISSSSQTEVKIKIKRPFFMLMLGCTVCFGSFTIGYSLISHVMLQKQILSFNSSSHRQYFSIVLAFMLPLGAILGCLVAKKFDYLGECKLIICGNIILIFATLCSILSLNIVSFCFSRILLGVGCGIFSSIIPSYLVSLAPVQFAGIAGGLYTLFLTLGTTLSYFMGANINSINNLPYIYKLGLSSWQTYLLLPILYSFLQVLLFNIFKYDSLERYYLNGQQNRLQEHLQLFYNQTNLNELIKNKKLVKSNFSYSFQQYNQDQSNSSNIICGLHKNAFLVLLALICLHNICGSSVIFKLFRETLLKIYLNDQYYVKNNLAKIYFLNTIGVITGIIISHFYGRKTLLIKGTIGFTFLSILLSFCYYLFQENSYFLLMCIAFALFVYYLAINSVVMTYIGQICFNNWQVMIIYWTLTVLSQFFTAFIQNMSYSICLLVFAILSGAFCWFLKKNMIQSRMKARYELLRSYAQNDQHFSVQYKVMELMNMSEDLQTAQR